MPGPKAPAITVTVRQRAILEHLIRSGSTPQQLVRRARVIVGAADGTTTDVLTRTTGSSRQMVQRWRTRWHAARDALQTAETAGEPEAASALEARIRALLADEPRPGAPPTFTPEQLCQLMAIACEPPADSGRPISQWTPRELADEAVKRQIVPRISARSVGRFLVLGSGQSQAASEPVLAHAPGTGPDRLRRTGGDALRPLRRRPDAPRSRDPRREHR
jgi:putative transposase